MKKIYFLHTVIVGMIACGLAGGEIKQEKSMKQESQTVRSDKKVKFEPSFPILFSLAKADELRTIRNRYGIRKFYIYGPYHTVRLTGYPGVQSFEMIAEKLNSLKEQLKDTDIELNFWCMPALTHGGPGAPYQHLVNFDGREQLDGYCPLDEKFQQDFARKIARLAELAKPPVILFDDDYTLTIPGMRFGCFCPKHLDAFAKAAGRRYTREELVKIYQDNKPETLPLRRLYAKGARDSLCALAAVIRKEVDKKSPQTRLAVCEPGQSDGDGYISIKETGVFAGPDTRPLIRVYGTMYSCMSTPALIPDTLGHAMYTSERLPENYEWIHESDTAPHTRFFMSAAFLETLMNGAAAMGADGALLHAAQHLDDQLEEPGYFDMNLRNMKRFDAIREISGQGNFDGCHVMHHPDVVAVNRLAKRRMANTASNVCRIASRLGIPYSTKYGYPHFLIGPLAELLSDEEIEKLLSSAVMLDAEAASILDRRGFSELLGVKVQPLDSYRFSIEMLADLPEFSHIKGRMIYNLAFAPFGNESVDYMKLIPLPGAETVSTFDGPVQKNIQPGMTRFINRKGGRVVVMASSISTSNSSNLFSYRKQEMIRLMMNWLRKKELPIAAAQTPNTWVLLRRRADWTVFYLTNLTLDVFDSIRLYASSEFASAAFEELDDQGKWQKVKSVYDKKTGILSFAGDFRPLRMRVFRTAAKQDTPVKK